MAVYPFLTQRHVKIWFSANPNLFLSLQNQLRLVNFKQENPRAKLTFVYSSAMLSETAQAQLRMFCERYKIEPLDFDTELKALCRDPLDMALYNLAQLELMTFITKRGGNLAAASDLIRIATPLLSRGLYSDFDLRVKMDSLPDKIEIEGPLLLNVLYTTLPVLPTPSSSIAEENYEIMEVGIDDSYTPVSRVAEPSIGMVINNNILGVSCQESEEDVFTIHPEAQAKLGLIQEAMVQIYTNGPIRCLAKKDPQSAFGGLYWTGALQELARRYPDLTIQDFRVFMDKATKNIFTSFRIASSELLKQLRGKPFGAKLEKAIWNETDDDFSSEFTAEEITAIKRFWYHHTLEQATVQWNNLQYSRFNFSLKQQQLSMLADKCSLLFDCSSDFDACYQKYQSRFANYTVESVAAFSCAEPFYQSGVLSRSPDDMLMQKCLSFDGNCVGDKTLTAYFSGDSYTQSKDETPVGAIAGDLSWTEGGRKTLEKNDRKLWSSARKIVRFLEKNNNTKPSADGADESKPSTRP